MEPAEELECSSKEEEEALDEDGRSEEAPEEASNEVLGGILQAEVALIEGVEAQWLSDAASAEEGVIDEGAEGPGSISQRPRWDIVRRGVGRAPAAASKKSASGPRYPLWIYFSSQSASKHPSALQRLRHIFNAKTGDPVPVGSIIASTNGDLRRRLSWIDLPR